MGTTGHWVFGADRAASFGGNLADGHTLLGAGTSGDELSLGPRLDDLGACQKIGIYRWKLVSPMELTLRPIRQDPCPRGQALVRADFLRLNASTVPIAAVPVGLPPACPLITAGEIAKIRGVEAGAADPSESTSDASDCIWTVSETNGLVVAQVTVSRFDPAAWSAVASDAVAIHGRDWVGASAQGNESLFDVQANGYLIRLNVPPQGAADPGLLVRQESSIADLVVSRLVPID
jgi:hypothetical protein